jgi:hypothetical protein
LTVCTRDLVPSDQHARLMFTVIHMPALLPPLVNDVIEVVPRCMIRRHHQRAGGILDVLVRDRRQPLVAVRDFMHPLLVVELLDRAADVPARQVLDDAFEGRIALPDDLIEPRRLETRLLELVIRALEECIDGAAGLHEITDLALERIRSSALMRSRNGRSIRRTPLPARPTSNGCAMTFVKQREWSNLMTFQARSKLMSVAFSSMLATRSSKTFWRATTREIHSRN